jgi:hypothetical protein
VKTILKKLDELSEKNSQIVLYKKFDIKNTMRGIGKIPGKFDADLLEFLKYTNGASIFDYCFLGFKNARLGVDIDNFMLEFWPANDLLAARFLSFMITSTNDTFGYLIDLVDQNGKHPVCYYSSDEPGKIYIIGSSFERFMNTFISDVQRTLENNKGQFLLAVDEENWPLNVDHWKRNDEGLKVLHATGVLKNYFQKNLPALAWQ